MTSQVFNYTSYAAKTKTELKPTVIDFTTIHLTIIKKISTAPLPKIPQTPQRKRNSIRKCQTINQPI